MELGPTRLIRFVATFAFGLLCIAATSPLYAGGFGGGGRAVGGVMIDANGIVRTATVAEKQDLANLMRVKLDQPQGDMGQAADMRMVSIKGLQQAIRESRQNGGPLPEAISLLAGLQRIEYVFVDTDNHDIVLAGPAEPWKLLEDGSVVGTKTGGAVLLLDDLVVALRTVETARNGGISVSIEPTAEGRNRLQRLTRTIKLRPGQNPSVFEESMKQAFGPQMIHLSGVPGDSRFARTLVAADYEMKRLAMQLVQSPVDGLPSYLQMAKNGRHSAADNPRWWMACNYDALQRSADGLTWKLSGQGVKTLTEQDIIDETGAAKGSGKVNKLAAQWADKMTEKFAELSEKVTVFRDLRNAMDLTVVATLINQEQLAQRAGLDMSLLLEDSDTIELMKFATPKAVQPQCSFVKGRSGWVITASGGVDINGFAVVENQRIDGQVAQTRSSALAAATDRWWWDK
jgi:hypothetical protein